MGCVGYENYQYFLQFAFWASLFMTQNSLFIFAFYKEVHFNTYGWTFFVSGSCLVIFGWFVFFMYGTMALKGVTIIEASVLFQQRRANVLKSDSAAQHHEDRTKDDQQRRLQR